MRTHTGRDQKHSKDYHNVCGVEDYRDRETGFKPDAQLLYINNNNNNNYSKRITRRSLYVTDEKPVIAVRLYTHGRSASADRVRAFTTT